MIPFSYKSQTQLKSDIYPVGSIYISVSDTNPEVLFGGTWVSWGSGRVPVGINTDDSDFATVEKQSGAKANTLTTDNLPSHNHSFTGAAHTHTLNNHTHSVGAHSHGLNSHTHSVGAHAHGLNSHTHSYAKANTTSGGTAITTAQMPSHNHSFTGKAHSHTPSNASDGYKFIVATGNVKINGTKRAWWTNSGTADKCFVYCDSALEMTEPEETNSVTQGGTVGNNGSGNTHTHSVGTTSTNSGAASGNTANSTAFNSGAASGSTANSSAFNTGGNTGNTSEATQTGTIGNTGSGSAISNLQPYITCYMWKRVA